MARKKPAVTEYRNYYLPMNFPVLLLSGDYWKISDIPSGRLHFHNCLEIGICHSDSGTMEFYGDPCYFKAGDVTVIPRNVPHTTYSDPGTESHWSYIYFNPQELFKNLLPEAWINHDLAIHSFLGYKHILSKDDYLHINQLVLTIIKELEEQEPSYQISARGLLLSLYIHLYRIESEINLEMARQSNENDEIKKEELPENYLTIAPALDYIEDHYMEQFSMDFLAQLCHWSPTHFRRVFHDIMGSSPLDYLNSTRIMKSCNLIRSTDHSILDISEMVGFYSLSSYNRYFTKLMQTAPRDYRKQMKQNDKRAEKQSILEYAGWMFPE